jgi:rod shape-determining protein MreD
MRWLVVAVLAYVFLVLQTTLFGPGGLAIEIGRHRPAPDLVLVLGIFLALYWEPHEAYVAGWCLGLGSDLADVTGRLGVWALLFALVLWALGFFRTGLIRTRVVTQVAVSVVVVFVVHLLGYVTNGYPDVAVGFLAAEAFLDGVYTAVLAPFVFWFLMLFRGPLRLPPGSAIE